MLDLIATWWNWVFHDLMGGSILTMLLFGWELFMLPIGIAIMSAVGVCVVVVSMFSSIQNP
jgi:hypothetical protein